MRVRNATRRRVTEAAIRKSCEDDALAEARGHALRSSPVDQERTGFELGSLGNDTPEVARQTGLD
jgi:hypothetical protein